MKSLCILSMILLGLVGCSSSEESLDPCSVLTVDQAQRFVSGKVGDPLPTGSGEGCSFGDRKDPGSTTLLVNLTNGDTPEEFNESRELAAESAPANALSGIGDEAFEYSNPSTMIAAAEARKGEYRLRVLLEGPSADPQAAIEALRLAINAV